MGLVAAAVGTGRRELVFVWEGILKEEDMETRAVMEPLDIMTRFARLFRFR
jgi:hypothetical protein